MGNSPSGPLAPSGERILKCKELFMCEQKLDKEENVTFFVHDLIAPYFRVLKPF